MERAVVEPVRGRLANVSAVVFVEANASQEVRNATAERLQGFFEDVLHAGPGSHAIAAGEGRDATALGSLLRALEAAREDRVLVIDPALGLPEPVWFGLCAWPEEAAVSVRTEAGLQPLCAIYQREAATAAARKLVAAGESEPAALLTELTSGVIEGEDLAPLLG